MSLTRRGFFGALISATVAARVLIEGAPKPQAAARETGIRVSSFTDHIAMTGEPPFSIPACMNERQGQSVDKMEPQSFRPDDCVGYFGQLVVGGDPRIERDYSDQRFDMAPYETFEEFKAEWKRRNQTA